jgi:hypothetical protein
VLSDRDPEIIDMSSKETQRTNKLLVAIPVFTAYSWFNMQVVGLSGSAYQPTNHLNIYELVYGG